MPHDVAPSIAPQSIPSAQPGRFRPRACGRSSRAVRPNAPSIELMTTSGSTMMRGASHLVRRQLDDGISSMAPPSSSGWSAHVRACARRMCRLQLKASDQVDHNEHHDVREVQVQERRAMSTRRRDKQYGAIQIGHLERACGSVFASDVVDRVWRDKTGKSDPSDPRVARARCALRRIARLKYGGEYTEERPGQGEERDAQITLANEWESTRRWAASGQQVIDCGHTAGARDRVRR